MKMMSSTSTTSTKGVMLISERELWVRPWGLVNAIKIYFTTEPQRTRRNAETDSTLRPSAPSTYWTQASNRPSLDVISTKSASYLHASRPSSSPEFVFPVTPCLRGELMTISLPERRFRVLLRVAVGRLVCRPCSAVRDQSRPCARQIRGSAACIDCRQSPRELR